MKNLTFFCLLIVAVFTYSCSTINIDGSKSNSPIDNGLFTNLLQQHVSKDGFVNYKGFIKDSNQLNNYLVQLSKNPPQKNWSNNDKIAFWINAYNAYTIKLIINHYPLKSIKDIGPANQVIFINTPWDKKFFSIGDREMNLNDIEHRILRKSFTEPRIHFALNCASYSCPKLRTEAYNGSNLNNQLKEQAIDFLNDTERNIVNENNPQLSSIFKWYGGDITKWSNKSLIGYLNQYSRIQMNENANINFLKYNWNLNEKK